MATRSEVMKFYKNAVRMVRGWQSKDPSKLETERSFMKETVREEIASLGTIADSNERITHLKKIQKWLDISFFYQIPYPRPYYFPTGATPHQIKHKMSKATRI